MKLTFAGVGSAFTTEEYYQSNMLLEHANGRKLLIDCGSDARFSLRPYGITNYNVGEKIDAVYISHVHMDHMGGLEWLGFCTYFNPNASKPRLYCHPDVLPPLWQSLKAGMEAHKDVSLTIHDFFSVQTLFRDRFEWDGITLMPVRTHHIPIQGGWTPSYGLRICAPRGPVFISTDTTFFYNIAEEYEQASLIFQDCETGPHPSGVHAHYDNLKELPLGIKKKMWLYHYYPDPPQEPEVDGFCGFVEKGQSFEI